MLSIIVPVYNEEESLRELHREIRESCEAGQIEFEVIFIDDGSSDGSWDVIDDLAGRDSLPHLDARCRRIDRAIVGSVGVVVQMEIQGVPATGMDDLDVASGPFTNGEVDDLAIGRGNHRGAFGSEDVGPLMRASFGGFTLTEMLVAITVLGAGILAVAGLVTATGERTRDAAWRTDRAIVAVQALDAAAALPYDSLSSTVDTVVGQRTYFLDIAVGVLGPSLKRLDLTASDSAAGGSPLRLTTLVARPAWLP